MELLERTSSPGDLPDGGGRLVFLGGEAGVGKTVLVDAFCGRVGATVRVLLGGCNPLPTPRPLGPLADIAAGLGGDIARLMAEQAGCDLIFRAALDSLARRQLELVVFEDVHWADEATIDLLRYLGRRIGGSAGHGHCWSRSEATMRSGRVTRCGSCLRSLPSSARGDGRRRHPRLRELGARGVQRWPRPSTRSNPAGLTRRELEVLQHLSAGLHNTRDCRPTLPLAEDGRTPCLFDPGQTRCHDPHRSRPPGE